MAHRPVCNKICNSCPFRRKAMPGWLGRAEPEGFIASILDEEPLPCHPTIDYEDPWWHGKWFSGMIGEMCRGALVFQANIAKLPRGPEIPTVEPDTDAVFATPKEFIDHHRSAKVRSWEMDD